MPLGNWKLWNDLKSCFLNFGKLQVMKSFNNISILIVRTCRYGDTYTRYIKYIYTYIYCYLSIYTYNLFYIYRTGKTPAIWHTAVRETGFSRHNGGLIRFTLEPLYTTVLWWSEWFEGRSHLCPNSVVFCSWLPVLGVSQGTSLPFYQFTSSVCAPKLDFSFLSKLKKCDRCDDFLFV